MRPTCRSLRRLLVSGLATGALLLAKSAFADRVTVLPLAGAGTTKEEIETLRQHLREATQDRGHVAPSDVEQAAAEKAVKDGVADTRDEYTAAGRAAHADWAVGGRIESRGHYLRVEIEACQVATGRVESLSRNVELSLERPKLAEMIALLLRPEGITNATIPWMNEGPPAPPVVTQPPPPAPEPVKETPKPAPPPPPAEPETPPLAYGEGKPFAMGLGASVLSAVGRPARATGNATTVALLGSFGYAISSVPGLELRGELGGGVVAPRSFFIAAGARYAWLLGRSVYLAPEVGLGGFVPVGGDKQGRFLLRGSPAVGLRLTDAFALEGFGDALIAPGGTGLLALVGGGLRGVVRF